MTNDTLPVDIATLYASVRSEVVVNHVLMHVTTLCVAIAMIAGVSYVERQESVVSVLLPIMAISWAASMVRFDFFIHRQGSYLRWLEQESNTQGWERWRSSLSATPVVVPLLDVIAVALIVVSTGYILFGPAQPVMHSSGMPAKSLAWTAMLVLIALLLSLATIPRIVAIRAKTAARSDSRNQFGALPPA